MTADVELLPLPEADGTIAIYIAGSLIDVDGFRPSTLTAYARANVRHRTAAQAAEIETLRKALRDLLDDMQHKNHNCGDEWCPVANARALLRDQEEGK